MYYFIITLFLSSVNYYNLKLIFFQFYTLHVSSSNINLSFIFIYYYKYLKTLWRLKHRVALSWYLFLFRENAIVYEFWIALGISKATALWTGPDIQAEVNYCSRYSIAKRKATGQANE